MEETVTSQKITSKRLSVLDSLRGVAAVSVVLFHFTYGYDNGLKILSNQHFYFRFGYLGVQLFFMISGFVILMTLEKISDSRKFIVSRFSRLYPAYWTAIILTVLVTILIGTPFQKGIYTFKQVLVNFTMLQYWVGVKDVDGAYWTLAVELCFYVWMWIIFITKNLKHIHWFAFAWITLALVFYSFNVPFGKYVKAVLILQYASLFAAGIGFFKLNSRNQKLRSHVLIVSSLVSEFLILSKTETSVVPYFVIGTFYFMFYLFVNKKLEFLSNKFLLFFGSISYSLYLIHENIGITIIYWVKQKNDSQLVYIPVAIIVVVAIAHCISKYIERPSMKWIRNRFDFAKMNSPESNPLTKSIFGKHYYNVFPLRTFVKKQRNILKD